MFNKIKKVVKGWLGIQSQAQEPVLGPSEKRLNEFVALEQEMLQRQQFVERQKAANKAAKQLLSSMKGQGLLPYQIEELEAQFLVEDEEFAVEFHRILSGEDEE